MGFLTPIVSQFKLAYAAATTTVTPILAGNNVQSSTVKLLNTIATTLQGIALALAVLIFVWGGVMYITGSEENARQGKKFWTRAAIGLIVALVAAVLGSFLKNYANQAFGTSAG